MAGVYYQTRDAIPSGLLDDIPGIYQQAAMSAIALVILDRFRETWPVDTAFSLSQWEASQDGETIFNDAEYAEWVHESAKYGGPPGIAERTWREIKGGSLDSKIRKAVESLLAPAQGTAADRLRARLRARGPSLADRVGRVPQPSFAPAPTVAPIAPTPTPVVFNPANGARIIAPLSPIVSGSAAVAALPLASVPLIVPVAARSALVALVQRLAAGAPLAVIQSIQRGDVRTAARTLQAIGRTEAARRLLQEARR